MDKRIGIHQGRLVDFAKNFSGLFGASRDFSVAAEYLLCDEVKQVKQLSILWHNLTLHCDIFCISGGSEERLCS